MKYKPNTDLSTVLFPVAECAVYYEAPPTPSVFPRSEAESGFVPTKRFRAIVDIERQYTFAVVGPDYRLVTNDEAIRRGRDCFRKVFGVMSPEDMQVFNVITPATRSYCHVDFTSKEGEFQPSHDDRWTSFLRVTNSYNRTRVLSFSIGFCRFICTNGLIFGGRSIQLRFQHTKKNVAGADLLHEKLDDIRELQAAFIDQVYNLKGYAVPRRSMLGLACKAFDLRPTATDAQRVRQTAQLAPFRNKVEALTTHYFGELGANGYAALNVLTDFATRPDVSISPGATVDSLQRQIGAWVPKFMAAVEERSFSFDEYLGEYRFTAESLSL